MRISPKALTILLLAALVVGFFALGLHRHLSLDAIQQQQARLTEWRDQQPLATAGVFLAIYIAVTALSLPGAAVMTLAGGALFGLLWGTVLVSFASSIGATLAMLASRWLLGNWVQQRFGDRLARLNEGITRDGGFYLFTLRLVPAFPFFLINLAMGLTRLPARTFYWVSQLGMLPGTLVYVNAGTQLGQIQSLSGIASPAVIGSLALLGVFPLLARKLMDGLAARRVYAGFQRPRRFDRNLIVIGGGSAGLVTAYIAAAIKAKVTLVEKHQMGGDCLNTGCVPSKALIRSARLMAAIREAGRFGLRNAHAEVDFAAVMERVQGVVKDIEPHDSVERYTGLGVEVAQGVARLVSPWAVEIRHHDGRVETLTSRAIVIAAGARPFVPPLPGLESAQVYTSETLWSLRTLPRRLVVLGGGPIGCELAQAFARLGSQVQVVEMAEHLLMREDEEVSALVQATFVREGIGLQLGHQAIRVEHVPNPEPHDPMQHVLVTRQGEQEHRFGFDALLVAVGRVANLKGHGLEELGVRTGRTVEVNGWLQTSIPNIYAAGDVAGPYQFTHTAAHQAWYAAVNSLFAPFKRFRADYRVIPAATFVEPEVARVGLNEREAKAQGIPYEVTRYGIDDLDRAIADGVAEGFVKVLTAPGKDRILGVTIVGEHAGDLIAEFVLAMKWGIGLNRVLGTIHIYPTLAEANKYAAGQWKRAHAPQGVLRWVERFFGWRRG